jgi:hypothetical protein
MVCRNNLESDGLIRTLREKFILTHIFFTETTLAMEPASLTLEGPFASGEAISSNLSDFLFRAYVSAFDIHF